MSLTGTMLTAVPTITLTALLAAECGDGDEATGDGSPDDLDSTGQPTPMSGPSGRPSGGGAGEPADSQENQVNIQITIGDQTFGATLQDSRASRDLVAQLPVTVVMSEHGGVEKTDPLPAPLPQKGQSDGANPDVGHLGYYAPGNDLVVYYGDQSYFPGIVVLGRVHGDAAEQIADMDGSVTATVEAR